MSLVKRSQDLHRNAIGYTTKDYLELVDWLGPAVRTWLGKMIGWFKANTCKVHNVNYEIGEVAIRYGLVRFGKEYF